MRSENKYASFVSERAAKEMRARDHHLRRATRARSSLARRIHFYYAEVHEYRFKLVYNLDHEGWLPPVIVR